MDYIITRSGISHILEVLEELEAKNYPGKLMREFENFWKTSEAKKYQGKK